VVLLPDLFFSTAAPGETSHRQAADHRRSGTKLYIDTHILTQECERGRTPGKRSDVGSERDEDGEVAFTARWCTAEGGRGVLVERSRFVRRAGRWLYLDGDHS